MWHISLQQTDSGQWRSMIYHGPELHGSSKPVDDIEAAYNGAKQFLIEKGVKVNAFKS